MAVDYGLIIDVLHDARAPLLHKVEHTARFTRVAREAFTWRVLCAIRRRYPHDWLFALGVLHARRIPQLVHLRVWAGGKGWLFQQEGASRARAEKGDQHIQISLPDTTYMSVL